MHYRCNQFEHGGMQSTHSQSSIITILGSIKFALHLFAIRKIFSDGTGAYKLWNFALYNIFLFRIVPFLYSESKKKKSFICAKYNNFSKFSSPDLSWHFAKSFQPKFNSSTFLLEGNNVIILPTNAEFFSQTITYNSNF